MNPPGVALRCANNVVSINLSVERLCWLMLADQEVSEQFKVRFSLETPRDSQGTYDLLFGARRADGRDHLDRDAARSQRPFWLPFGLHPHTRKGAVWDLGTGRTDRAAATTVSRF